MQESFLHYVWQFQYYSRDQLTTSDGEPLTVFKQGMHNPNSGPDFSNAKVKVGNMDWAGMVEIHVRASEWFNHKHHQDKAYENVVLHVVWEEDKKIKRNDGTIIPTLVLKDRVAPTLVEAYKKLINNLSDVPCYQSFPSIDQVTKFSMLDKALAQRLQKKAKEVETLLSANKGDWEETTYQLLARNFGFKVNSEPLLQLARSLPFKTLLKHSDKLIQIEAMMFGQAGFLKSRVKHEYLKLLQREYSLLATKYKLQHKQMDGSQWRFLRMRPANFPTIRLAQFCALIGSRKKLFSQLIESNNPNQIKSLFTITQSEYWLSHYQFGKHTKRKIAGLGDSSVDGLCINTIVPLLVAYGKQTDEQHYVDRAVELLQSIPSESNRITKLWKELGYHARTAFDSQALIELYREFCLKRNCLNCTIGSAILKPSL